MSQTLTLKGQCIAEFFGTGPLISPGVGCVTALKVAGASFGQWEISIIWRLRVVMIIYLTAGTSGTRPNPAVTIALWLSACFDKRKVIPFIVSQAAGTFYVTALAYGLYYNLFFDFERTHYVVRGSVESADLAGTFSTYPSPHINFVQAFAVEMVITAILMGLILMPTDDSNGVPYGPSAPLLISLLIAVIGASVDPLTGFTMSPVRDFGPKVFAWLADWGNAAFTGDKDIPHFLAPLFGPIAGAIVDVFIYRKLIGHHLLYDICVVEEKETTTPSEQEALL